MSLTPRQPGSKWIRALAPIVALVAMAVILAACGGAAPSDDGVASLASPTAPPDGSAGPSASVDPQEAAEAFTACMKEHGVDVAIAIAGTDNGSGGVSVGGPPVDVKGNEGQAVQPGGNPIDEQAMAEADAACRHLLPSGTFGDPNATMDPALADQLLDFAQCMRDHGIDYPDPTFSGGGVTVQIGGPGSENAIDPNSEAFQAATTECAKEMPSGAPFSIGGGPAPVTAP